MSVQVLAQGVRYAALEMNKTPRGLHVSRGNYAAVGVRVYSQAQTHTLKG